MSTTSTARARLVTQRDRLRLRYRDEIERAGEDQEHESESVDHSTMRWDDIRLSSLGEVDAKAMRDIVAAIDRLDAGRYGLCVRCQGKISRMRLRALPSAATCIRCAKSPVGV
jgi:RNA polymerase-binding transcription factor